MTQVPHSPDAPPAFAAWLDREIPPQERATLELPFLGTVLRHRGVFEQIDDTIFKQIEQQTRLFRFHNDEVLCTEGTVLPGVFVVLAGEVRVVKPTEDGATVLVYVLQAGDWGGLMGLLGGDPIRARVIARGDTILRVMESEYLIRLVEEVKGFAVGLLAYMGRRLHDDSLHLSAALEHVSAMGLDEVAGHCSPDERLMLDTIRHHVVSADSLGQIMELVFAAIPQQPGMRMALSFLEDPGGRVICQWTKANYEPLLLPDNYEEDIVDSLLEESFRTSQAAVINDLEDFACHHPFNQGAVKRVKEGLRTCIVAPLRVGSRVIGFLMRSSKSPEPVSPQQVRIHQAIADSIGPVVEKAYRVEMLTRANERYSDALSFISHELQSPIASMVTDAKLMEEGYLGKLTEQQRQKVLRSIKKGEYLLTMIRSFLNIARLEAGSLMPQMSAQVNLDRDVVQPEFELLQAEFEENDMRIDYTVEEDLPLVECDPGLLRIAVGNLLRNAIKYGLTGHEIRVSIGRAVKTRNGGALTLSVWNAGPGFSEQQKTRLFRKFSRLNTPGPKKTKGTGIGLYSASRIMHLHHGTATARSREGEWAEFQLTLPLKQPSQPSTTPAREATGEPSAQGTK